MASLLKLNMAIAGIGLVLSVIAHVAALAGVAVHGQSWFDALVGGLFVVWVPTVVVVGRVNRGRAADETQWWKTALSGAPTWMARGVQLLFVYTMINLVLVLVATPDAQAGSPAWLRLFSAPCMTFYGTAFAVMYSAIRKPSLLRQ